MACNSDAPPKSTHNPTGKLVDQPPEWSVKELHLFNSLGIAVEGRRETNYFSAILSCRLCVFVLPENEDRLIRPGTFKVAVLMASGETFSLAIPILASIYQWLNVISRSLNPSYSGAYFPVHYLYVWLAQYFNTNHVMDPSPPGPLMVSFSSEQGSKFFKDVEARRVIHEGSGAKVGCNMLNKNKNTFLFDGGNLDQIQMSYLSSLRSGYVSLHHYDSFFIDPYLPYLFSRKFGFFQDIPSAITREHKLKTVKFYDWWTMVTIKDLRHNINKLFSIVEPSSSNPKKVSAHDEVRDVNRPANGHASQRKGTGDNVCATSSKRLHLTGVMAEVGDIDFEIGASFNIDDAMIDEAIEPLYVLTNRTVPGKGKEIHIERNLVERGNSASPTQTHYFVNGLSVFEINAKTLGIPLDAKGIPRAPSHGDAIPAPSIFTIRITPASQGICTSVIKILENEYLTLPKQTPFDKVSVRHGEAFKVYKAIRVMHDDPKPLKCNVDEYVWGLKGHRSLTASLSDHLHSDQVEEERLAVVEELKLAESSYV
ncbi:Pectate lyase 1 [Bienertia sinuspersici]